VQGGGAYVAEARAEHDRRDALGYAVDVLEVVVNGETLEPRYRSIRDGDLAGIEPGHFAGDGCPGGFSGWVEDDANYRPALIEQRDAHREEQHAMGVVVRAVNRIDDPPEVVGAARRGLKHLAFGAFLGDEAVVGVEALDVVDDEFLADAVGLRDDVGRVLYGSLDIGELFHGALTSESRGDRSDLKELAELYLFEFHRTPFIGQS